MIRPHTKLREVRSMTIAIGFSCQDGIVLCADRQVTFEGYHKYSESKIYCITVIEGHRTILFSYSGDLATMKAVHDKMARENEHLDSPESIQSAIEKLLSEMPQE